MISCQVSTCKSEALGLQIELSKGNIPGLALLVNYNLDPLKFQL
jgi:hypothetical protein